MFVRSRGGGGGSRRMTTTQKQYLSIKTLLLRHTVGPKHKLIFENVKDRTGEKGERDINGAIDDCADMLTKFKFQGSNEMFQEGIKLRLVEAITKILLEDDYIPTQETIEKYLEGGE
jgi:hypothetical protein